MVATASRRAPSITVNVPAFSFVAKISYSPALASPIAATNKTAQPHAIPLASFVLLTLIRSASSHPSHTAYAHPKTLCSVRLDGPPVPPGRQAHSVQSLGSTRPPRVRHRMGRKSDPQWDHSPPEDQRWPE